MLTKDQESAYFAGLFDGEGSVYIRTEHGKPVIILQLGMTCLTTMERLRAFAGHGHLGTERRKKEHHKTMYRFRLKGRYAVKVFDLLLPYLITKRQDVLDKMDEYRNRPVVPRAKRKSKIFVSPLDGCEMIS